MRVSGRSFQRHQTKALVSVLLRDQASESRLVMDWSHWSGLVMDIQWTCVWTRGACVFHCSAVSYCRRIFAIQNALVHIDPHHFAIHIIITKWS